MSVPDTIELFHITHGDNLRSIVEEGGLLCKNQLTDIDPTSSAYESVQGRRARTQVPIGPGGNLHDYVPFYFAPRSPMLYVIEHGDAGDKFGQKAMLQLRTAVEEIRSREREFVFTDGHAIMAWTNFYSDMGELSQIDWQLMKAKYWKNTDDDPNRQCRRQAEFLVRHRVPWETILEIGVYVPRLAERVEEILDEVEPTHRPKVSVQQNWYY